VSVVASELYKPGPLTSIVKVVYMKGLDLGDRWTQCQRFSVSKERIMPTGEVIAVARPSFQARDSITNHWSLSERPIRDSRQRNGHLPEPVLYHVAQNRVQSLLWEDCVNMRKSKGNLRILGSLSRASDCHINRAFQSPPRLSPRSIHFSKQPNAWKRKKRSGSRYSKTLWRKQK